MRDDRHANREVSAASDLEDIYIVALKSSGSARNAARQLGAATGLEFNGDQCVGLFWEKSLCVRIAFADSLINN